MMRRAIAVAVCAHAALACGLDEAQVAVAFSAVQRDRPTLLVSYPSPVFLDSLAHLRKLHLLPPCHLVFLLPESEAARVQRLKRSLRAVNLQHFEVVVLLGGPGQLAIPGRSVNYGGPNARRRASAFRHSPALSLPLAWVRLFARLVARSDGLVVPGGGRVPAALYGQPQFVEGRHPGGDRAVHEYLLLRFLLGGVDPHLQSRPDYLVVGFGYGLELLNTVLGGTLHQSIDWEVYGHRTVEEVLTRPQDTLHRNPQAALVPGGGAQGRGWFHPVRVRGSSPFLPDKSDFYVLSSHRQAVKQPGRDLRLVLSSKDGRIPEALQHTRFPHVIGIQGHPERRFAWERMSSLTDPTRWFHRHFFARISAVLKKNHAARREQQRLCVAARTAGGPVTERCTVLE